MTWFFEKRRTTFQGIGGRLIVPLDEIPELGFFVEIEGPLNLIRELEAELGGAVGPQERRNYAEVFRAYKINGGARRDSVEGAAFVDDIVH
ncbi:MAG: hypothetical protein Q7S85_06465 [Rugosibacter sp.]|nr:hypothetical protein [Rugosibacter sp.]